MLEFFKGLIFKNKIDKSYIADRELEKEIKLWLRKVYLEDVSFEIILLKLGIEIEKKVYLKRIPNVGCLSFYYGYEMDVNSSNRIDLITIDNSNCGSVNNTFKIVLSGIGYRKNYHCINNMYVGDKVILEKRDDMVIKNLNDITYIRRVELYGLWIKVQNKNGDEIVLNCTGRFDVKIKNELELEHYLTSLSFPVSIIDVYRNVCKISFDDEREYSKFDITILKDNMVDSSLSYSKEDLFSIFTPKRKYEVKSKEMNIIYYRYLNDCHNVRNYNNLSGDTVKIEMKKNNYRVVIEVKIGDLELKQDVKLNNEIGLRDYLVDLEFPLSIDELYKKICEISLGDVSKYEDIKLDCYYKDINIDSLRLHYGKFKFYYVYRDEMEVILDENGEFLYKTKDNEVMVFVNINDDKIVNYGITYEEDKNNMNKSVVDAVNEARRIKVRTRKIIDEMLVNSKNDSN